MRVLITGVSGQDGIHLAEKFVASGHEVFGQTRNKNNYKKKCLHFGIEAQISIVEGDLSDEKFIARILNSIRPDIVYHLSGQSSVSSSFKYPEETWKSIASATELVLFYMKKYLANARLINSASSECFGSSQEVRSSSSILSGLSPYAEAKIHSVELVRKYNRSFSLDVHNIFLFPHESFLRDERFLVGRVLNLARAYYLEDSDPDFSFVKDISGRRDVGLASEYMLAMKILGEREVISDCVVGTGVSTNLSELINELLVSLGFDSMSVDLANSHKSRIASNCVADIAETKKVLAWSPSVKGKDVMKSIGESYLNWVKNISSCNLN